MSILYNLARMTTGTTGTGTITLGSPVTGFLSFAGAGVSNGETVSYGIRDGANSEVGRGVYTSSGTTLTRVVSKSTNSDAAINLSGSAEVYITPLAEDLRGKQTIWVPAAAMQSRTTNGAADGTVETSTNKLMLISKDFDASTDEFVQFDVAFPKGWNEGTVTFIPVWTHPATTVNFGVSWFLQGVSLSNDNAADTAFGTAQESQDTGGTTDDIYVGPESSAITIANTPAEGDWTKFQLYRDVSDAGDTMAVDARLHGIQLLHTVNTLVDD